MSSTPKGVSAPLQSESRLGIAAGCPPYNLPTAAFAITGARPACWQKPCRGCPLPRRPCERGCTVGVKWSVDPAERRPWKCGACSQGGTISVGKQQASPCRLCQTGVQGGLFFISSSEKPTVLYSCKHNLAFSHVFFPPIALFWSVFIEASVDSRSRPFAVKPCIVCRGSVCVRSGPMRTAACPCEQLGARVRMFHVAGDWCISPVSRSA